jgi:hypothetical protein
VAPGCREKGIAGFVSFRLNDAHHKKDADDPKTARIDSVPQFYAEHPEYRLGRQTGQTSYAALLHDWAREEVREFKFRLIEELCANYDLDGLELDFMRHPYFFKEEETTGEQRREIMTAFVAHMKKTLDATAREGRVRWLCVRIPAHGRYVQRIGRSSAHAPDGPCSQQLAHDLGGVRPFPRSRGTRPEPAATNGRLRASGRRQRSGARRSSPPASRFRWSR